MIKWSRKYDKCISCGNTEKKHQSKGLCTRCHDTKRNQSSIRKRKTALYKKKYIMDHPKILDKCKIRWKEWMNENKEIMNLFQKGRRWKKEGKICMQYKGVSIPLDITSRDKEIQRQWEAVKLYLDNKKH